MFRSKSLLVLSVVVAVLLGMGASVNALEADVIVVGGGAAGLASALEAADQGAEVILLEKMPFAGGSSVMSAGIVYAADTSVQEEMGIDDTAEDMFHYWMTFGNWRANPQLARIVADRSAETIHWLLDLGVEFPGDSLFKSGADTVARGHVADGAGAELISVMLDQADERGITMLLNTEAVDLVLEDGRVTGVHAVDENGEPLEISGNAVVLATGGFGQNEEMLRRNIPHAIAHSSRYFTIAGQGSTGDGISMATRVGADVVGMERSLLGVRPEIMPIEESTIPGWLVLVNKHGQRFVNEGGYYDIVGPLSGAQDEGLVWAIFDESMLGDTAPWTLDKINDEVEAGRVQKADSLEELAVSLGINPAGFVNTMEAYNTGAAEGVDHAFEKSADLLQAVDTPPYYGVQVLRSRLVATTGGLRINETAAVLDTDGQAIAGLYAAGETTGGVIGENYPGSGAAIVDALVFGRIAGESASQE